MRAAPTRFRRPTRISFLAVAWALWVVLVQALGGTTALVHAHDGADGHLHFVASHVRETDHAEWHRRAHGAGEGERGAGPEFSEGALELLLEFPAAPQIARGDSRGEHDVEAPSRELAPCAFFTHEGVGGRDVVPPCAAPRGSLRSRAGPRPPLPLRL